MVPYYIKHTVSLYTLSSQFSRYAYLESTLALIRLISHTKNLACVLFLRVAHLLLCILEESDHHGTDQMLFRCWIVLSITVTLT